MNEFIGRQGDWLFMSIDASQPGTPVKPRADGAIVVSISDTTGHTHVLYGCAMVLTDSSVFCFEAGPSAVMIHEDRSGQLAEHEPIEIPEGFYLAWRQREHVPGELPRNVED